MTSDPVAVRLGAFEMGDPLGKGGMCEVWSGVHAAQGTPVAIKIVSAHARWRDDRGAVEGFYNEIRAMAGLNHPNIAAIFDFGQVPAEAAEASGGRLEADSPYVIMERASGGTVHKNTPANWSTLRELLLSLLDALSHAHARGIVHRDLKPANILWCNEQDLRPGPKLTDFGIAHIFEPGVAMDTVLRTQGTPQYMAPEQIRGQWRDYGPWTDLYALGCVAFRLICGRPPYDEDDWRALITAHISRPFPPMRARMVVPEEVESWIRRLTRKDPRHRYACAADARLGLLALPGGRRGAHGLREVVAVEGSPETISGSLATIVSMDVPSDLSWEDEEAPTVAGAAVPTRLEWPAMPLTWRRPGESMSVRLFGVGLGLYPLRAVPMVGRSRERDLLWAALRSVRERETPTAVILRGAAGNGKSRLAEWLVQRAAEVGAATELTATHGPTPGPIDGLGPMIARHLRCGGLDKAKTLARLEEQLRAEGVEDPYEWKGLTRWLHPVDEEQDEGGTMRLQSVVERYFLLSRVLSRACRRRPVIVWLDDLQWGDDALSFVRSLLDTAHSEPMPVLIVATVREEALARAHRAGQLLDDLLLRPDVQGIDVGPLPGNEHQELVHSLLGLDSALAQKVVVRTAGNPLFAVQLIGDWIDRGILVWRTEGLGGFALSDGAEAELPDRLHGVWIDHLGHLLRRHPAETVQTLEIAAVLGQEVDLAEWHHVCQAAHLQIPENLLQELLSARLALNSPRGWRFAHGMLRESLLRQARESGRLVHHHQIAVRALRAWVRTAVDLERLGQFSIEGGDPFGALDLLGQARLSFRGQSDHPAEERTLGALLEVRAALGTPESDPEVQGDRLRRIWLLTKQGRLDEAESQMSVFEGLSPSATLSIEPRLLHLSAARGIALERGKVDEAMALDEEAVRWSDHSGDVEWRVRSRIALGAIMRRKGRVQEALQILNEAIEALSSAGITDNSLMISARHYRAACFCRLRMWGQAAAELEDLIPKLRRRGDRVVLAHTLELLGEVHRMGMDDLEGAEGWYRESLHVSMRGSAVETLSKRINLALVLMARGQFPEARTELEAIHTIMSATGVRRLEPWVAWGLLTCHSAEGRWAGQGPALVSAVRLAIPHVDPDMAALMHQTADQLVALGEVEGARQIYVVVRDKWEQLSRPDGVAQVDAALAALVAEGG